MGSCFSARIKAESPVHEDICKISAFLPYIIRVWTMQMMCDCSSTGSNSNYGSKVSSVPSTPRTEGEILQSPNIKNFCFSELRTATRNFRPDSMVGEGGFGSVFKGWIDEHLLKAAKPGTGTVIAVKRLNQEGLQGHKEWLTEINYLGQLSHPNLVKLIGYCLEDDHRLLVYEFMPRGSLDNHLFRRASYFQPLPWNIRMKVALGAAKGLAYLHSDEVKVIYRDFKTSNILLDSNYDSKLSDFGLAKDGPEGDKSYVSTRVMGTFGYAAPEYMATGIFKCITLFLLTFNFHMLRKLVRAVDKNRPTGEHNLVEWAKPYLASKRRVLQIFDARIEGQYSVEEALRAVNLAIRCIATEPKYRPNMKDVVKALEQLQDLSDKQSSASSQSTTSTKS
ncbi:hypothetical protein FEM48_Zijuj03G0066800 [Ziziphus jujuba var. spinosa]|uniref:non-specific serine/threonine protein kinase n=1 Tax=Ziziphus jujuba var. spinosa TaxID=714518 RepID=A0A978VNS3_ZIZJJ|nr:hypothetical protein FEM48_Zijuj03G0066800 [Ziziphus jujuba var. spinosa]